MPGRPWSRRAPAVSAAGSEPQFSVVVPVYNATKIVEYFRMCMASILEQDHKGLELILVDDASDDATPALLEEYKRLDERVRTHRLESKRFVGAARNAGIELARGQYIVFVDFDDYIFPNALSTVLAMSQRYGQPDVIQYGSYNVEVDKFLARDFRTKAKWRLRQERLLTGKRALRLFLSGHLRQTCWSKAVRGDVAKGLSFPDELYWEDLAYSLKVFASADRVLLSHQPLYAHLWRPGSYELSCTGEEHFMSLATIYEYMVDYAVGAGVAKAMPHSWSFFQSRQLLYMAAVLAGHDYSAQALERWYKLSSGAINAGHIGRHLLRGLFSRRHRMETRGAMLYRRLVRDYQRRCASQN